MNLASRVIICAVVSSSIGCSESVQFPPALGTLERDRIDIVADSNEPIARVLVSEGDIVSANDVLVVQDASRAVVALSQAQAEEAAARSALSEAERGPRQQQIAQSRSRLRAADSTVKTTRFEVDRELALVERQLVSRSAVDITQGKHEEALARQAEARAALDELLEGTRSEEIDQVRARHAAAIASVENLQITVARARILAPVDGTIEALPFEIGERPPGGATVVSLLARGPTYARIHVSAPMRGLLRPGAAALIWMDGRAEPLQGTLRWASSRAAFTPYFALNQHDRSRLSYVAEVDVESEELPVGIPVEVTFPGAGDE